MPVSGVIETFFEECCNMLRIRSEKFDCLVARSVYRAEHYLLLCLPNMSRKRNRFKSAMTMDAT